MTDNPTPEFGAPQNQPGPGYGPPPGYGQPPPPGYGYGQQQPPPGYGYGGYPVRRTSGKATAALITAIAAWLVCPVIPAIVSLVLAGQAKQEIAEGGGWVDGEGQVTAAKVISIIHLVVSAIFVVVVIALLAGTAGTTSDYNY